MVVGALMVVIGGTGDDGEGTGGDGGGTDDGDWTHIQTACWDYDAEIFVRITFGVF